MKSFAWVLLAICTISMSSCSGCSSGKGENWKKTYPVTGEVFVDGQAAEGVSVSLRLVGAIDTANLTVTGASTDAEGKFSVSTYEEGDGAPEGEYVATFTWGQLNKMTMEFQEDKFKGKYSDPKKSEFKIKVGPDAPADMGRIELKTR